jgi:hypothetical protein
VETIHLINRLLLWLYGLGLILRLMSFAIRSEVLGKVLRWSGLACLAAALLLTPVNGWLSWDGQRHEWVEDGDALVRMAAGLLCALSLGFTYITRQTD